MSEGRMELIRKTAAAIRRETEGRVWCEGVCVQHHGVRIGLDADRLCAEYQQACGFNTVQLGNLQAERATGLPAIAREIARAVNLVVGLVRNWMATLVRFSVSVRKSTTTKDSICRRINLVGGSLRLLFRKVLGSS